GAVMREVGTTNRTKLADYERAITPETVAILRVHPSNYRVVGFTATPSNSELSALAREKGILFLEDAGSGAFSDLGGILVDEPIISRSLADGADLVTFSGDKLLGGPQSGIIVGRADLVAKMRKHPLYRVLRADKMAYAALEATLGSYAREAEGEEIPVHRMLAATRDEINARAERFAGQIKGSGIESELIAGDSVIGGGSVPGSRLPTALIALTKDGVSAETFEQELRSGATPVIGRIEDGRYLLDLRTVDPEDEPALAEAISAAAINRVAK
ncbi:MAG TPA: L-seryl-tRNA(Sec) selenium transferase, partial [Pyrinomonadaceae bacterium]|nr:L-seryl-tRNA(Sec) selenium transferase [Pyrinomonadaceae bacterium]